MPHPGIAPDPGGGRRPGGGGAGADRYRLAHSRLYDFAEELGASTLAAHYSRYVVDLNRPSDDKAAVQHRHYRPVSDTLFDGRPLYRGRHGAVRRGTHALPGRRVDAYHRTIAEELARLKAEFGYALLWDAH